MVNRLSISVFMVSMALMGSAAVLDKSYKIVRPDDEKSGVSKALRSVAKDLAGAIKEGTGLKLKVVTASAFEGRKAIFLGAEAAKKAGLLPDDLTGYANMIAEKDGNIYLFGRDVSGRPKREKVSWKNCVLPTAKATVRFIEKYMGGLVFAPGEVGIDVPKMEKLEVPDGVRDRQQPRLDYAPANADTALYAYAANAFGAGRYHSYGGHSYPKAVPTSLFKEHPEYFGLIAGRRTCHPLNRPTICISNPEVEDLMVQELLRQFDEGAEVCQLAQQDGQQWCGCEKCRTFGGPEAKTVGERIWIFHRRIAERVAKLRPGKKVNILNYSATLEPPETFKVFPENVMIELCHVSEARLKKWQEYTVPQGFVSYLYLWGNYPIMGFTPKRSYNHCAEMVRKLFRYGVHGIYRCGFGELYGMEGPQYHVFNRVIEDPEADVNALVNDYCRHAFGPKAGPIMRQFYDTIDRRLRGINLMEGPMDGGALKGDVTKLDNAHPDGPMEFLAYAYTPDVLKRMNALLSRAERMADTPKRKTRLALVRTEFDYASNLGTIVTLFNAYQLTRTKEAFAALADALEARKKLLDDIYTGNRDLKALPRKFEGWPEIRLFGNQPRSVLETNGRLLATMRTPLCWDAKALLERGVLPGAQNEKTVVRLVKAEPSAGDFEAGDWASAPWLTLGGAQMEMPRVKARFKLLAGPKAFYVAAESAILPNVEISGFKHDGPTCRQENFDMLFSPFGQKKRRYHFIWNPADESRWDAACGFIDDPLDPLYNKDDVNWNGEWTTRNSVKDGIWRSFVKVPYASLGVKRPERGEKWLFNLGRDANKTGKSSDTVRLLWSPNVATQGFSNPDAMGELEFK